MSIELNRRSLITGLISLVAAPAIVRAASLMPVREMSPLTPVYYVVYVCIGAGITCSNSDVTFQHNWRALGLVTDDWSPWLAPVRQWERDTAYELGALVVLR